MRGIQFELCEVPCLLNHGKSGRPTTTGSPFLLVYTMLLMPKGQTIKVTTALTIPIKGLVSFIGVICGNDKRFLFTILIKRSLSHPMLRAM